MPPSHGTPEHSIRAEQPDVLARHAEAVEHYEAAIELDADYHPAYDSLARLRAALLTGGLVPVT